MATFDRLIRLYQVKIGSHDSPTWEPSVEERSLRSIHDIPKKATTFKSQLIDVDLVDGSTFFKAKPSHAWPAHVWKGLVRLLCMPAYFSWWRQHTSFGFAVSLLIMYVCQLAAIGLVFYRVHSSGTATAGPSMSEVINPLLMMMVLSVIHTQIVFTQSSHHSYTSKKSRLLEKKKRRQKVAAATCAGLVASTVGASSLGASGVLSAKDKRRRADIALATSVAASKAEQSGGVLAAGGAVSPLLLPNSSSTASVLGYKGLIPGSPSVSCPATATSCNASTDSSDETYVEGVKCIEAPSAGAAATAAHNISVATIYPSKTVANLRSTIGTSAARFPFAELSNQGRLLPSGSCVPPDCTTESTGDQPLLSTVYDDTTSASGCSGRRPSALISLSCDEVTSHEQLRADVQRIVGSPSTASSGWARNLPDAPDPTAESTHCGSQLRQPRQLRQPPAIVAASVNAFNLNASASAKDDSDSVAAAQVLLHAPPVISESTATSDGDTPSSSLFKWASEWESCRMHSSDVNSTDSSSECSVDTDGTGGIISGSGCPSGATTEDGASPTGGGSKMSRRRRRIMMQTSGVASVTAAAVGATELPPSAAAAVAYIPSAYDRISCIIWEDDVCKKADLSVIDMGAIIEQKVEQIRPSYDYVLLAVLFVLLFSITPFMYRIYHSPATAAALVSAAGDWTALTLTASNWTEGMQRLATLANGLRCEGLGLCFVMANSAVQRVYLSALILFLLAVAERTYWQRLLYAKHFSYLTSSRRSRKYDVPHFRLNKVKSIKTWLSLRSFLKRRGSQRSVDVIVSATFVLLICLLAVMCAQLLRDYESFLTLFANWELTVLCLILGVFLLRYYGLGTKINKTYRNLSILITEEINLYLQMEQKPHKKDDLMVANSVLKLALDLIKEVESPFKMSNLNVNPVVFNVTKLIMLSAFSAVLSELFGFKLKLSSVKME